MKSDLERNLLERNMIRELPRNCGKLVVISHGLLCCIDGVSGALSV